MEVICVSELGACLISVRVFIFNVRISFIWVNFRDRFNVGLLVRVVIAILARKLALDPSFKLIKIIKGIRLLCI
jgi:hypothetical protein